MASNVPTITFGNYGFVAPSEVDILAGVLADIDAAFGGGLNPSLETPQGQLATSITAILGAMNDAFLLLANQIDPTYSSGRMQDAIAQIYFLSRNGAEPTVVQARCYGALGVVITEGVLAQAVDGNTYACLQEGVIDGSGFVTLPFACTKPGPIPCPAGALSVIFQSVPGWNSITNPTEGVLGRVEESRSQFEERRAASVASNSRGSLAAVLGAVLAVPNVLDAFVTENVLPTDLSIGGYLVKPKSIYVAVVGGTPDAVAKAIWSKKAPGCDYNGNTLVTVLDQNPAYTAPYPAYQVRFQVPDTLPNVVTVFLTNSVFVPSNATTLIRAAILNALAGGDGGPRAQIGGTVFASRFYAAVAALGSWAQIIKITIGSANAPNAKFTASITSGVLNVTSMTSGAIAIGQTVTDDKGTVVPGMKVVSFGTGTGGTGTYNLSKPQTLASRVLTTTAAAGDQVSTRIDQVPTIAAEDVTVTLQ